MEIKIDKNATRDILMAMWEDLARDLRFDDKPKGGIYDLTDEEVEIWIVDILQGHRILSYSIENGFYKPCTEINTQNRNLTC